MLFFTFSIILQCIKVKCWSITMDEQKTRNNNDELHAIYGGKTFVKFKQALDIEKMKVSFVEKENTDNFIDIYMSPEEFGADLIRLIKTNQLANMIKTEKAKGEQYPQAVWTSPLGGTTTDGKTVARYFTISPGSSQEVVLTAKLMPATSVDGKYVPTKGAKDLLTIRVGCSLKELYILAYTWSFLEQDYFPKKYNVEAMRNQFHQNAK